MCLEKEIQTFHQSINYKEKELPVTVLKLHQIETVSQSQHRRKQVKVRSFHFQVLHAQRLVSNSPMLVDPQLHWEPIEKDYLLYMEKELIQFALQCLYIVNIPNGECIVQRNEYMQFAVIQIQSQPLDQLNEKEEEIIRSMILASTYRSTFTFGADLEVMLFNKRRNKFINGDFLIKNGDLGFDDCVAIQKNRVIHPIIEVRPQPAKQPEVFHENLEHLYRKLTQIAKRNQLEIITTGNPFGRFFLGGHIHFGNLPLTFQHVRLLDQFVALPFSIIENPPSYERRCEYGRLGSVRENQYNGFEYRVLPTWFHNIPLFLPILRWVQYLMSNVSEIETRNLQPEELYSYYRAKNQIKLTFWGKDYFHQFQDTEGETYFKAFIHCLKNLN